MVETITVYLGFRDFPLRSSSYCLQLSFQERMFMSDITTCSFHSWRRKYSMCSILLWVPMVSISFRSNCWTRSNHVIFWRRTLYAAKIGLRHQTLQLGAAGFGHLAHVPPSLLHIKPFWFAVSWRWNFVSTKNQTIQLNSGSNYLALTILPPPQITILL